MSHHMHDSAYPLKRKLLRGHEDLPLWLRVGVFVIAAVIVTAGWWIPILRAELIWGF